MIQHLKTEGGGAIFVVGGRIVIHPSIEANAIDEYRLFVVPVLLGGGASLLPSKPRRHALRLIDSMSHATGLVRLRYLRGDYS